MPVVNSIADAADQLREWRQDFHRHPELGYKEHRTAKIIAERLHEMGFDAVETGIGGTGVVGVLHGRKGPGDEGSAIMLRADMDALPIHELNDTGHRSQTDGTMHACGHDGHITMLLGGAQHLARTRAFEGTVYVCFQPAEEGGAGAKAMIEDGLFDRFPCRAVYGMHNWPGHPVGSFHCRSGPLMAASDEFTIRLKGRGGHAAKPDTCLDPVPCGAAIVQALQTVVARRTNPLSPAVVTVTIFQAGDAFNVIPDTALLGGTVRSFDSALHTEMYTQIERIVRQVAAAHEIEASIERSGTFYPETVNDAEATAFSLDVARAVAGAENVHDGVEPTMGSEDFSYYALEKPACFMLIGNGDSAGLHHPRYDFDDEGTVWGASYWSALVERALPIS